MKNVGMSSSSRFLSINNSLIIDQIPVYRLLTIYVLWIAIPFVVFLSCSRSEQPDIQASERLRTVIMESDLVIGSEDQPPDHQLGQALSVRTDSDGNIYISDLASLTIKVFDSDGHYIRSLGGRGRGPGEFQMIEFMELTPEGHLVIMDRGNLLYTTITTRGEYVESFPYNFSNQFYPTQVYYNDGKLMALFLDTNPLLDIPGDERHLFHIYTLDYQELLYSFFPFLELEIEGHYPWLEMSFALGRFSMNAMGDTFIYSPGIYYGKLYVFKKQDDGKWALDGKIEGIEPIVEPYAIFTSETQYNRAENHPGTLKIFSAGGPYFGNVLSINTGIFHLQDGRIIHFFGQRRENEGFGQEAEFHYLDIYAQIFSEDFELESYGLLHTIEERLHTRRHIRYSLVNWKDDVENFYLMELKDDVPLVRRFTLVEM
ncbi:MAG: hypothetical protein EA359_10305 [Balneolaceae bacterium]|nr:MAG: hypothetical protein EA359_10305 [Balneolaceae bacterium]